MKNIDEKQYPHWRHREDSFSCGICICVEDGKCIKYKKKLESHCNMGFMKTQECLQLMTSQHKPSFLPWELEEGVIMKDVLTTDGTIHAFKLNPDGKTVEMKMSLAPSKHKDKVKNDSIWNIKERRIKSMAMYLDAKLLYAFYQNNRREMLTTVDYYLLGMIVNIQQEILDNNGFSFGKQFNILVQFRDSIIHFNNFWKTPKTMHDKFQIDNRVFGEV